MRADVYSSSHSADIPSPNDTIRSLAGVDVEVSTLSIPYEKYVRLHTLVLSNALQHLACKVTYPEIDLLSCEEETHVSLRAAKQEGRTNQTSSTHSGT